MPMRNYILILYSYTEKETEDMFKSICWAFIFPRKANITYNRIIKYLKKFYIFIFEKQHEIVSIMKPPLFLKINYHFVGHGFFALTL